MRGSFPFFNLYCFDEFSEIPGLGVARWLAFLSLFGRASLTGWAFQADYSCCLLLATMDG